MYSIGKNIGILNRQFNIFKVNALYPETYGGAFDRHHSEMGTSMRLELTEHLESVEIFASYVLI